MTGDESVDSDRDHRLNEVIAKFLEAERAGQRPDRDALLRSHPDLSEPLRAFFADHDRMRAAIGVGVETGVLRASGSTPLEPVDQATLSLFSSVGTESGPRAAGIAALSGDAGGAMGGVGARVFGDYELIEMIARGGMGVVYKARQRKLNRIVALKMILGGQLASPEDVRRFHAEAEAAAHLDHPGIVPIYEVGEFGGQHFFSMGYIEGPSLAQRLSAGPMPVSEAVELMRQVALAVAYAHAKGVVHRDLKPANILLSPLESRSHRQDAVGVASHSPAHGTMVPKITDFGLAKRLDGTSDLTHTGQILGTPNYMPPEQAAGHSADIREASDIYALGAILYTMLTGQPPFQASNPLDVLVQVLESEPTMPRVLRRDIPRELEWICLRCLDKQPQKRYASAADLADDLDRLLKDEPVMARPSGVVARVQRWARREPSLAAHLAALVAALLIIHGRLVSMPTPENLVHHLKVCAVLLVWGVAAMLCQQLLNRDRTEEPGRYVWSALDVMLMTMLLYIAGPPRGPLLISYPLLIVASGLFFRVRLVMFTTAVTMAAYPLLLLVVPEERPPIHYAILLETVLAILGLIVAYQVQRVRVLSRYFEHRGPSL